MTLLKFDSSTWMSKYLMFSGWWATVRVDEGEVKKKKKDFFVN